MTLADILRGGLYVLDTPGALTRGAVANLADIVRGQDRFQGYRATGREMLESMGMERNRPGLDWGDVAGLGADFAVDPLNLVGGGALTKILKTRKAAKATNALRAERLATGGMPEEVAKLTKAVDASGKPLRTYHGTAHAFDKYDKSHLDPYALYGKGIYTTADPEIASDYVRHYRGDRDLTNEELLAHYAPGNVVPSYGGSQDEVLEVFKSPEGEFQGVKVRAVAAPDTPDYLRPKPRVHATRPSYSDLYPPQQNVRMQYIDARNPWDMQAPLTGNEAARTVETAMARSMEGPVWSLEDDVTSWAEAAARLRQMGERPVWGSGRGGREGFFKWMEEELGSTEEARKALARAGYDAITHTGGQRMGNKAHDVWIAFDPSQVYSPWIAPAERAVPRSSPLAAALAAYNAQKAYPRQ